MNIYCFSTLSFAKLQFKSVINKAFHKHGVASFTDAWIETRTGKYQRKYLRRIFYRCVDWNHISSWTRLLNKSHLLQMRGLKHTEYNDPTVPLSRIFYRCVDWNVYRAFSGTHGRVASFTDAWIETCSVGSMLLTTSGRIFYRCVDWNPDGRPLAPDR